VELVHFEGVLKRHLSPPNKSWFFCYLAQIPGSKMNSFSIRSSNLPLVSAGYRHAHPHQEGLLLFAPFPPLPISFIFLSGGARQPRRRPQPLFFAKPGCASLELASKPALPDGMCPPPLAAPGSGRHVHGLSQRRQGAKAQRDNKKNSEFSLTVLDETVETNETDETLFLPGQKRRQSGLAKSGLPMQLLPPRGCSPKWLTPGRAQPATRLNPQPRVSCW
jgi:hypothetical protein